jgi:pseudouridine synthase
LYGTTLRRREADDAVSAGRVRVNGSLVLPSLRVRGGDVVTLDGKTVEWEPFAVAAEAAIDDGGGGSGGFVYLVYNKPRGVTCTMEHSQQSSMLYALKDELRALSGGGGGIRNDDRRRSSINARSKSVTNGRRVFPVGRLDRDSDGLVLLTDDGRVPDALLDPTRKATKTYHVDVRPAPSEEELRRLRGGVVIETTQQRGGVSTTAPTVRARRGDSLSNPTRQRVLPNHIARIRDASACFSQSHRSNPTRQRVLPNHILPHIPQAPCGVDVLAADASSDVATLRFQLSEGRNRQIRKMCEAIGVDVLRLRRVALGGLELGELEVGGVRALRGDELKAIAAAVARRLAAKREDAAAARDAYYGRGGRGRGPARGRGGGRGGAERGKARAAASGSESESTTPGGGGETASHTNPFAW